GSTLGGSGGGSGVVTATGGRAAGAGITTVVVTGMQSQQSSWACLQPRTSTEVIRPSPTERSNGVVVMRSSLPVQSATNPGKAVGRLRAKTNRQFRQERATRNPGPLVGGKG